MSITKKILLPSLLLLSSIGFTQVEDTIENKDIEVIKEYTPFLEDGKKQSFSPTMPAIVPSSRDNLTYTTPSQFVQTQFEPDEIKPLPIDLKESVEERNFYLKAGYGNKSNPLAQFAISGSEKDNYSAGILGNFQAVKGDLFDDQKMSDANLTLFGTKEVNNASLDADLHFKQDVDYLYGYDHSLFSFDENDTKTTFNNFGGKIGLQSTNRDDYALKYKIGAGVDFTKGKLYDFSETQTKLNGQVTQRIFDDLSAELNIEAGFRNMKNVDYNNSPTVLNATPIIKPEFENLSLEIGASLNNDDLNGFKVFPHVSLELPFANDQYTFYAGWKGKTELFGLQQTIETNSRINQTSQFFLQNYTKEIRTPAGIKGSLNDNFGFNLSINQEVTKNAPIFNTEDVNSILYNNIPEFETTYEAKLTNWKPSFDLNYQLGEKVNALANLNYNIYSTESNLEAYGLPTLESSVNVLVTPINKLKINGGFDVLSGIQFFDYANNTNTTQKTIFDANIGAEYAITDNINIFIDANNLANQEYERWINYPVVGTNILAGIVLSY